MFAVCFNIIWTYLDYCAKIVYENKVYFTDITVVNNRTYSIFTLTYCFRACFFYSELGIKTICPSKKLRKLLILNSFDISIIFNRKTDSK